LADNVAPLTDNNVGLCAVTDIDFAPNSLELLVQYHLGGRQ